MAEDTPPLIVQYTNLLHDLRDPDHPVAKAFVEQHKDDRHFMTQVGPLNRTYQAKEDVLRA